MVCLLRHKDIIKCWKKNYYILVEVKSINIKKHSDKLKLSVCHLKFLNNLANICTIVRRSCLFFYIITSHR